MDCPQVALPRSSGADLQPVRQKTYANDGSGNQDFQMGSFQNRYIIVVGEIDECIGRPEWFSKIGWFSPPSRRPVRKKNTEH